MLDQSHNVTDPIESLIESAAAVQRALAQALLVDRNALTAAQETNDALGASRVLRRATQIDVEPLLRMARVHAGGASTRLPSIARRATGNGPSPHGPPRLLAGPASCDAHVRACRERTPLRIRPRAGYEAAGWEAVALLDAPDIRVIAPAGATDRGDPSQSRSCRRRTVRRSSDLGQNMVGWAKLTVDARGAAAGHSVTLRHAEVLDGDGNLYTDNLRAATQRVEYILAGDEARTVFEPHFTFQGFRYVAVEGYPGEPTLDDLRGVVIHSDMAVDRRVRGLRPAA